MTKLRTVLLLALIMSVAACGAPNPLQPAPAATATGTGEPASAATVTQPVPDSEVAPATEQDLAIMAMLPDGTLSETQPAIDAVVAAGDTRYIPVFIELMRAAQLGIARSVSYRAYVQALEDLSGQDFGDDWPAWIEWYGRTGIAPPAGFTGWKGRLLGRIDPAFGEFLQDDRPSRIRVEEIVWGGVVVDGIPALDNASMIPADQADYLEPLEPVFGLSINGDHRAYPLRILDWHEMANDVVGGVPVSLAYCTLCGAGIAYDGRASDGNTYTFGSSGLLARSNKLMYDRQTRTLWNQLTGEPVLGPLAGSDVTLNLLPVVVTSWAEWLEQHPDTLVLSLETGYQRPYAPGAAYGDYFAAEDTMFPVWQRSNLLPAKARIYALRVEGIPKAYPVELLATEQVVNDQIGETGVVLVANRGQLSVAGLSRQAGAVTYDAGGEVRVYDRGIHVFEPGPTAEVLLDADGRQWQVTEEALIGPDGRQAPRLAGHLAYWFGWYGFFPNTLVYEAE